MSRPYSQSDHFFMQEALKQAQRALRADEVPIGAVVVDEHGVIIARGYNQVEKKGCQSEHAEMIALRRACKKKGDWRLYGCWVYVTLEPCSMCMSFMKLSRVAGVVYGADSPLFGYHLDKDAGVRVYNRNAVEIVGGICAEKSVSLLKQFFKQKRKNGESSSKQSMVSGGSGKSEKDAFGEKKGT